MEYYTLDFNRSTILFAQGIYIAIFQIKEFIYNVMDHYRYRNWIIVIVIWSFVLS